MGEAAGVRSEAARERNGVPSRQSGAKAGSRWRLVVVLVTLTLLSSGCSLWGWGSNVDGSLGDGTTTNRTAPVQIGALTEWEKVDAGGYHTHALLDS